MGYYAKIVKKNYILSIVELFLALSHIFVINDRCYRKK